eukprot:5569146-Prymnesium_polylepis.1
MLFTATTTPSTRGSHGAPGRSASPDPVPGPMSPHSGERRVASRVASVSSVQEGGKQAVHRFEKRGAAAAR